VARPRWRSTVDEDYFALLRQDDEFARVKRELWQSMQQASAVSGLRIGVGLRW